MSTIGHNSTGGIAAERLRAFIDRIIRVEEEIADLNADKKEIYAEAKSAGFDVKTMKVLRRRLEMEPNERQEADHLLGVYEEAYHSAGRPARAVATPPHDPETGEIHEEADEAGPEGAEPETAGSAEQTAHPAAQHPVLAEADVEPQEGSAGGEPGSGAAVSPEDDQLAAEPVVDAGSAAEGNRAVLEDVETAEDVAPKDSPSAAAPNSPDGDGEGERAGSASPDPHEQDSSASTSADDGDGEAASSARGAQPSPDLTESQAKACVDAPAQRNEMAGDPSVHAERVSRPSGGRSPDPSCSGDTAADGEEPAAGGSPAPKAFPSLPGTPPANSAGGASVPSAISLPPDDGLPDIPDFLKRERR